MSVMGASTQPRVRDLAREAMALMAFSAGLSTAIALLIVVTYGLGH